jgi:two-component system response regulator PilR (NtrC family)
MQALTRHAFPGNVRELENLLHRAVALSAGHSIEAEDLGLPETSAGPTSALPATSETRAPEPVAMVGGPSGHVQQPATGTVPVPADLVTHLDQIERDILVQALEQHRLNRTAAGAAMGLSLRQMRYRMARLGVQIGPQGVVIGERFVADADPEGLE